MTAMKVSQMKKALENARMNKHARPGRVCVCKRAVEELCEKLNLERPGFASGMPSKNYIVIVEDSAGNHYEVTLWCDIHASCREIQK